MKKVLSLILSLLMVVTILSPIKGYADFDKELQGAITKAKELFNITEEYDKFDYHVNGYDGKTRFSLSWNDSNEKLRGIRVTMDSKGEVLNYYKERDYNREYKPKLAKVSKSDAVDTALEFIKKVNPDVLNNIKYVDSNRPQNVNSDAYYINFVREENDLLFKTNSIEVSIDNMTGEVINYYYNWDDSLIFPSPDNIISLDEAKEIFKDEIGLKLMYKLNYDDGVKPYLVYSTLNNRYIDAITGEIVKNDYRYYFDEVATVEKSADSALQNLSPEELSAIKDMEGLLSDTEAEKIARDFLEIDESYTLRYNNLSSDYRNKGEFIWHMNFEIEEEDNYSYRSISIDAKTGDILSFSKHEKYDEKEVVKYDKDKAFEIAKDYISQMSEEKASLVQYADWNEPIIVEPLREEDKPRRLSFRFVRYENDAYLLDDGFNVTIDTITGDVVSYSQSWYKGELPSTENVMDLDQAHEALFNEIGMNLEYTIIPQIYYEIKEDTEKKVNLLYGINNDKPLIIDPYNGNVLDYRGKEYIEETIVKYDDIENSYGKSQIEILAQYGISLPGDKFNPKNDIVQREFLYLLAKAGNYYINEKYNDSEEFDKILYNRLKSEGIIMEDEISPEAKVTREDAVKFAIRSIKYDKVAEIEGIFLVNFKDNDKITKGLEGYIAIAQGLGIVNGSNGYFYPDKNLTKEQGAIVIYNLLNSNSK